MDLIEIEKIKVEFQNNKGKGMEDLTKIATRVPHPRLANAYLMKAFSTISTVHTLPFPELNL